MAFRRPLPSYGKALSNNTLPSLSVVVAHVRTGILQDCRELEHKIHSSLSFQSRAHVSCRNLLRSQIASGQRCCGGLAVS